MMILPEILGPNLDRQLRSNSPQERLNREIHCRTDVVGIFPDRAGGQLMVAALTLGYRRL